MRWGLVPVWAKSAEDGGPDTKGPLMINARAETVTSSPAFRNSAKGKRVWCRWTAGTSGGRTANWRRARRRRRRRSTCTAAMARLLFMAGLWSTWRPGKWDAPKRRAAAAELHDHYHGFRRPPAEIHYLMPLTISKSDRDRWLDPDAPIDEGLLRGHGDLDRIEIREVSRLVNTSATTAPN